MLENSIMIIHPYLFNGVWVFDDESTGLVREPFVSGIPEMINKLVYNIKNAKDGFNLHFSSNKFPDYNVKLTNTGKLEAGGTWYSWDKENMTGWLCPALLKYFKEPPEYIYAKVS
jgi:hypothetical protein